MEAKQLIFMPNYISESKIKDLELKANKARELL